LADENETQQTIERLRVEHRDLDEVIDVLIRTGYEDESRIQRLKKKKLRLRDQLTWLENVHGAQVSK